VFVLQHVAGRHGFPSILWCSVLTVGLRPDVAPKAHVFDRRHGVCGVYNHGQIDWPIPVPDPPHSWASGSAMPPHDQAVLEQSRVRLGLTSRRWVMAHANVVSSNVVSGAVATDVDTVFPRGVMTLLNTDQLREVTDGSAPTAVSTGDPAIPVPRLTSL
jgi:hypothetical protein